MHTRLLTANSPTKKNNSNRKTNFFLLNLKGISNFVAYYKLIINKV